MNISSLRKALITEFPTHIVGEFCDVISQTHVYHYHMFGDDTDIEETYAVAVEAGYRYIKETLLKDDTAYLWDRGKWRREIHVRIKDAVLKFAQKVKSPVSLPRPVHFSIKKYKDVLKILFKYSDKLYPENTEMYQALFYHECSPFGDQCSQQDECPAGFSVCPLVGIDRYDAQELYRLIRKTKTSLSFYAKNYRKSFGEWIRILEYFSNAVANPDDSNDLKYIPDPEADLDLKRLAEEMDKLDPEMFEVYLKSLTTTNIDQVIETGKIKSPKAWIKKYIAEQHDLSWSDYKELLEKGDTVINDIRRREGLSRIYRVV